MECTNKRIQELGTFYYTISAALACSCSHVHSLGGAYSASGSETNHKYVFAPQECRFGVRYLEINCYNTNRIIIVSGFLIEKKSV